MATAPQLDDALQAMPEGNRFNVNYSHPTDPLVMIGVAGHPDDYPNVVVDDLFARVTADPPPNGFDEILAAVIASQQTEGGGGELASVGGGGPGKGEGSGKG